MSENVIAELSKAAGVAPDTSLEILFDRIMKIQDLGSSVPTPLALLMVVKADKEGVGLDLTICTILLIATIFRSR
jgi:hypothetical protein